MSQQNRCRHFLNDASIPKSLIRCRLVREKNAIKFTLLFGRLRKRGNQGDRYGGFGEDRYFWPKGGGLAEFSLLDCSQKEASAAPPAPPQAV